MVVMCRDGIHEKKKNKFFEGMASYKNNQDMPGPNLEPMSPNWDKIDRKWNEELFRLFIANCEENIDGNEIGTDIISMKCSWTAFSASKT